MELSTSRAANNPVPSTNYDGARKIWFIWYLNIFDVQGKTTTITLYFVKGSSPLIIGLNIDKLGHTKYMGKTIS